MRNFSSVLHLAWHAIGRFFKQPEDGARDAGVPRVVARGRGREREVLPLLRADGDAVALVRPRVQRRLWEESERLTAFGTLSDGI